MEGSNPTTDSTLSSSSTSSADGSSLLMTAVAAALGKLAAVNNGYYSDEILPRFVPYHPLPPHIQRSNWMRAEMVRRVIDSFLQQGGSQIISLGAGFETNFFQLIHKRATKMDGTAGAVATPPSQLKHYIEFDLPEVTRAKIEAIESNHLLLDDSYKTDASKTTIHSSVYHLMSVDIARENDLRTALNSVLSHQDYQAKTLIIAECVLTYLSPDDSDGLIRWLASSFDQSAIFVMEPISAGTLFEESKEKLMEHRCPPFRGLKAYPTIESHQVRYRSWGWQQVEVKSLLEMYQSHFSTEQQEKTTRLPDMDEETRLEFEKLLMHYCLVLANNRLALSLSLQNVS
eukprot:TRINITY_DN14620_c0_g1_i1.p1 TRINITY_DN14620_c0_g1~~TRINITY_DN14620_c0_g1_i1.p1  ORF type:complete len:344 (+),score=84.91 TRINITY_DN14620_c0_g1_i1:102-1133(+)